MNGQVPDIAIGIAAAPAVIALDFSIAAKACCLRLAFPVSESDRVHG